MLEKKILSANCSPEISLDPTGVIKIKGRAMHENESGFSEQIENWVDEYICNPADLTSVEIYLEYFNVFNSKLYFSLLKKISSIKLLNKNYVINWYYEEGDEDILEKGEDISCALEIPFNFIMIDDPLI